MNSEIINPAAKKTVGQHVTKAKHYKDTSDLFLKKLTTQSVYNSASSMEEKFMQQKSIEIKKIKFYKKDAKTEETTPLLPKRSTRN